MNINIPDIADGRPVVILGLVWTIILHCHVREDDEVKGGTNDLYLFEVTFDLIELSVPL